MSKMSNDLDEVYQQHRQHSSNLLSQVMGGTHPDAMITGVSGFKVWADSNIALIIKMGRARFDGGDHWETASQAMEATMEYLNDRMYEFLVQATSYGMCVGFNVQNPEFNFTAEQWNELYHDKEIWKSVLEFRNHAYEDPDTLDSIGHRIGECGSQFANFGFVNMTGKETCHVWDLWREVLKATGFVLYRCGLEAGKKWYDEEVLKEIEKATEGI